MFGGRFFSENINKNSWPEIEDFSRCVRSTTLREKSSVIYENSGFNGFFSDAYELKILLGARCEFKVVNDNGKASVDLRQVGREEIDFHPCLLSSYLRIHLRRGAFKDFFGSDCAERVTT